jgi:uncharacterized protein YecE (DUF72 family)
MNKFTPQSSDLRLPASFFGGISGLQLPTPKYLYPPEFQESSRLTYYASIFNSIEFNSSFYKVPQSKTVAKWSESVNNDFRFTFKLWKQITHCKELTFEESGVDLFLNNINSIGDKKGCLLVQLPPKAGKENFHQLNKLLGVIKTSDGSAGWNVAIEFRNSSWYEEGVYEMLNHYKTAMVIHDKKGTGAPFLNTDADFVYVRFHGPTGNYRGSYDEDFLSEYAGYIRSWMEEGKTVYAYFNNTMGQAYQNLITLQKMVKK